MYWTLSVCSYVDVMTSNFIKQTLSIVFKLVCLGLDPEARRTLWDMLEKNKIGRTILLTTHFMEEADVLGDRIAIMARGELKACGSSLFLKTRFGVGYHLTMSLETDGNDPLQVPNRVFDVVNHYVPEASLEDYISNSISFILPLDQPLKFIKLFEFLEESGSILGVESFGCSLTTLEEVFSEVSSIKFEETNKIKTLRRQTLMRHISESKLSERNTSQLFSIGEKEEGIDSTDIVPVDSVFSSIIPKEPNSSIKRNYVTTQSIKTATLKRSLFMQTVSKSNSIENSNKQEVRSEITESNIDSMKSTVPVEKNVEIANEKRHNYRVGSKRIKTILLRERPRLQSVLDKVELGELAPTHEELVPVAEENLFRTITLNTGITLRIQQIWAVFVKKVLFAVRRYQIVFLQFFLPFAFTILALLNNYINSTVSVTNDLVLSVDNTFTRPDRASIFFMDTPGTNGAFPNNFTLSLLPNFAQLNGNFEGIPYLDDYLAIINSIETYTNVSQCCGYEYQILDEFCSHLLASAFNVINYCANINPSFGYANCPQCLDCASSSSDFTCPRPPRIVYNPASPGVFSDTYRGPLPVDVSFIDENILRLGSVKRVEYLETYFAGFTTNRQVPFFGNGECLCCSESVTVTNMNESSGVCSDALTTDSTCNRPGVGRTYPNIPNSPARVTLWHNTELDVLVAVGLVNLHNYQLNHLWKVYNLSGTPPTISIHNHPLPIANNAIDVVQVPTEALSIALFIGFALAFVGGSFIIFTVEERENRSKFLQYVSGLHSTSYWVGNILFDAILSVAILILTFLPFTFFPNTPFTGSNLLLVWLLLLSYIISALLMAYLFSFLFDSTLVAFGSLTVIHFLSFVLGILISQTLALSNSEISQTLQYIFSIFPCFSVANGIYRIYINTRNLDFCSTFPFTLQTCRDQGFDVEESQFSFQIPGVLLFIVLPTILGIISFILTLVVDKIHFNQLIKKNPKHQNMENTNDEIDDDVLNEKERIKFERNRDDAIVIKNLTKIYTSGLFKRSSKLAVNNLSLGLRHGECFGLLGVNGAGKTTTFEMLTGNLAATSGSIRIERFDVRTQLSKVQQMIGYCPQFDALQGYLNSYQLLTLYSRIRGIPEKFITEAVQTEIDRMHLQVHAKFSNQTYSGGNKRKLSSAAALIGGPPIILLDEPTTGMDPDSRREFWDVIEAVTKAGRTIVLTTHSMEECEALCTRLAIMVNGEFKCLGNVQHLKTKFGDGYTINLQMKDLDNSEENGQTIRNLKDLFETQFPGSKLMSEHSLSLDFHIPSESHHYSEIFMTLEEFKLRLNIASYGVSQTTLEQVFLHFAKLQVHGDQK